MEEAMPNTPGNETDVITVAVVGVGTMGYAMAVNLRKAGLSTVVWDRNPSVAAPLAGLGASVRGNGVRRRGIRRRRDHDGPRPRRRRLGRG